MNSSVFSFSERLKITCQSQYPGLAYWKSQQTGPASSVALAGPITMVFKLPKKIVLHKLCKRLELSGVAPATT